MGRPSPRGPGPREQLGGLCTPIHMSNSPPTQRGSGGGRPARRVCRPLPSGKSITAVRPETTQGRPVTVTADPAVNPEPEGLLWYLGGWTGGGGALL